MPGFDAQGNYIDPETGRILIPASPLLSELGGRYGQPGEITMPPDRVDPGSDVNPMAFPPDRVAPGAAPIYDRGGVTISPSHGVPDPRFLRAPAAPRRPGEPIIAPGVDLADDRAEPAAPTPEDQKALALLTGLPGRFADEFKGSVKRQADAKAEQAWRQPWDPKGTFGRRVALDKEEQDFTLEQDRALEVERARYEHQAEKRAGALKKFRDAELKRLQGEYDEWAKTEVDPKKVFHDANFVEKAMGILGALFGSQAAFSNGGRNPAMEIINRMVDQSIEAQKANLDAKGRKVEGAMNLYQVNLANRLDEEQAWHQTKAMKFEALARSWQAKYGNAFADKEHQQSAVETYESLMAQAAKEHDESARLAEKHIYEMAETEARIRETLTKAGLNEANIKKVLGDIKGAGGAGVGASPQKTGAGFANESAVLSHFGFDKPGEVPPTLGNPFKAAGGELVTEVVIPGSDEGPESVFGVLRGKAFLEDSNAVVKLRGEAVPWNQLLRSYRALEEAALDRKSPWDGDRVRNKAIAANAALDELMKIKGAASESDWQLVKQSMGDLMDPNKISDLRDEDTRRQVFEVLRQRMTSLVDSSLSSYSHVRIGKDGKSYEFRLRWRPPQVGIVPRGSSDEDAELGSSAVRQRLKSGSADLMKRGAVSAYDRAARALKSDDWETLDLAAQEAGKDLRALRQGRQALDEVTGVHPSKGLGPLLLGPTKAGPSLGETETRRRYKAAESAGGRRQGPTPEGKSVGEADVEAQMKALQKKIRTTDSDSERRVAKEELTELERRERIAKGGRGASLNELVKKERALQSMYDQLRAKAAKRREIMQRSQMGPELPDYGGGI